MYDPVTADGGFARPCEDEHGASMRAGRRQHELAGRSPRSKEHNMFERFTDRARRVVVLAQEEAREALPMARAPRIALIEPGGMRREVPIASTPFRIGRQAGNELTVRDSRISRQQAQILAMDGAYVLEDMGSRHGTFINGQRVVSRQELHARDKIDFGMTDSYRLIFVGEEATLDELLERVDKPAPSENGSRELYHLGVLLEVARTLGTGGLSLEDVLTSVVDAAIQLTRTERGVLLLLNDKGRTGNPRRA